MKPLSVTLIFNKHSTLATPSIASARIDHELDQDTPSVARKRSCFKHWISLSLDSSSAHGKSQQIHLDPW